MLGILTYCGSMLFGMYTLARFIRSAKVSKSNAFAYFSILKLDKVSNSYVRIFGFLEQKFFQIFQRVPPPLMIWGIFHF